MFTLDRIWVTYLVLVLGIGLCTNAGGDQAYHPGRLALALGLLLAAQAGVILANQYLSPNHSRVVRTLVTCGSTPIAYTAIGWLLPAVHPEPYEWTWLAFDHAVFGGNPTVVLQRVLTPWFVEVLQWVYASFYLLPIGATLVIAHCRGSAAFDRAMTLLTFGFLVSYCGYLLFPTLPPARFLAHGPDLDGVWQAQALHQWLITAEGNEWDCFPSGHTMMSLMSLWLVWRWARPYALGFAVVVVPLVFSTMALRYHWSWDVLAGALLVWPTVRLGELLLARDGAPAA